MFHSFKIFNQKTINISTYKKLKFDAFSRQNDQIRISNSLNWTSTKIQCVWGNKQSFTNLTQPILLKQPMLIFQRIRIWKQSVPKFLTKPLQGHLRDRALHITSLEPIQVISSSGLLIDSSSQMHLTQCEVSPITQAIMMPFFSVISPTTYPNYSKEVLHYRDFPSGRRLRQMHFAQFLLNWIAYY